MQLSLIALGTLAAIACSTLAGCAGRNHGFSNESDADLKRAREIVLENTNAGPAGDAQLRGITRLCLALDYMQNWKRGVNPSEFEILQPITRKLRMAGIKVVPFEERRVAQESYLKALVNDEQPVKTEILEEMPLIQQEIQTIKWVNNTTLVSIQTLVHEDAVLVRDMGVKQSVVTWRNRSAETDVVENSELKNHILKVSMEQIDGLLDDWLKQNGR